MIFQFVDPWIECDPHDAVDKRLKTFSKGRIYNSISLSGCTLERCVREKERERERYVGGYQKQESIFVRVGGGGGNGFGFTKSMSQRLK